MEPCFVLCRQHIFKKEDMAHKSGRLTTLEAHANAPLFASANIAQVVKLWSENGELLTGIRAANMAGTQAIAPRIGRTTCLSLAPYELKIATGASDAHCSVYGVSMEDKKEGEAGS
jgi:hypothetical protein